MDVLEIDGASNRGINEVRELRENVRFAASGGRSKIYIIDEVHMLTQEAFNALLKTLEEPPPHVKFIFATTDPHKVLPTVVSRCQRYDLRRIGLAELRAHLRHTVEAEGAGLSEAAVALIAREAEGSLRDAQSLLEQILTVAGADADEGTVREVLGAADRRLVVQVAEAIVAGDPAGCVRRLGELHAHGYDAQRFCRDLLEHFRHLAVLAATGERALLADLPETEVEALAAQAARRSADDLQRFFHLLLAADEALSAPARTVDPRLVLEMCVVRLATLSPLLPVDDIVRRLEALGAPVPAAAVGPAPAASPPAAGPDLWDRFLARVREEKLALYLSLASGRLISAEADALRIGIDNETMRRELARKETVTSLEAIAKEVVGRPLRVEVGPLPKEHAGDAPLAAARRRTEETLADPLVQAAVEIFGAEVRGVRDRRGP